MNRWLGRPSNQIGRLRHELSTSCTSRWRRWPRVRTPGVCRSRHPAREWRLLRHWRIPGAGERVGGYAESLLRLEHASAAALRNDDVVAGLRLLVDRRLLALERLRVGLGQRPLGAP